MADESNWQANSLSHSEPARLPVDSLSDILRDVAKSIFNGHIPPPLLNDYVARVTAEYRGEEPADAAFSEQIARVLDVILRLPRARIAAACLQSILRQSPRSEQEIADELGVSKAWVSKHMCLLRDFLELGPRAGRSDTARQTFAMKRVENYRKKPKQEWALAAIVCPPQKITREPAYDASPIRG